MVAPLATLDHSFPLGKQFAICISAIGNALNPFTAATAIWRFGLITNYGNDAAIILNFHRAFNRLMRLS